MSPGSLLFECDALFEGYQLAKNTEPNYSLNQWIPALQTSDLERLEQFRTWLPPEQHSLAPRYLTTIEKLREALILSAQDASYCFSLLPQTPKNQQLHDLLQRYLDSPLKQDRTQSLWDWIGQLKTDQNQLPVEGSFTCVYDLNPSFLFTEVCQALRSVHTVKRAELKNLWEMFEKTKTPPTTYSASSAHLIPSLVYQVQQRIQSGTPAEDIAILFAGDPNELFWIRALLHAKAIPYQDHANDFALFQLETQHAFLANIRQDQSRPLKERLAMCQEILLNPPQKNDRTVFSKGVSLSRQKGLHLLPFLPLNFDTKHAFYFVGSSYLQTPRPDWLLEWKEVETLCLEGFALPRPTDQKEQAHHNLRVVLEGAKGEIFTNLNANALPPGTKLTPLPAAPENLPKKSSHRVGLTLKSLSATQLESYVRCPTQYLYSNRLNLQHKQSWEERYALIFGITCHLALEHFFREAPRTESALIKNFKLALQSRYPEILPQSVAYRVLCEHFNKLAPKIIQTEAQLQGLLEEPTIFALESDFSFDFAGATLRGKIDRMEKLPSGDLLLIDYKTGNLSFSPNHIAQGTHFQALLYLLSSEKQKAIGMIFYDLKKGETRRGWVQKEKLPEQFVKSLTRGHALDADKFEAIREAGLSALTTLIQQIHEGDFEPVPDASVCDSCAYPVFCRKGAGYV